MVCLGLKHGAAGWKAHINPLSHSGTPLWILFGQLLEQIGLLFIPTSSHTSPVLLSLH